MTDFLLSVAGYLCMMASGHAWALNKGGQWVYWSGMAGALVWVLFGYRFVFVGRF